MGRIISLSLAMAVLSHASAMIMRNNALMSKMISQFQGKPRPEVETEPPDHGNIVHLMQNVLCKNFPTVPCEYITNDFTLRELIEKSIQQLKHKKVSIERSTLPPYQLTLFPAVNSEDLSNFLQVRDQVKDSELKPKKQKRKRHRKKPSTKNHWSHEQQPTVGNGRKALRKFYPHKVKYKDKKHDDYSDEKSMSGEMPHDHPATIPSARKHFGYGDDPDPVWRIDYMKHGEPSLNMFQYDGDNFNGKIMRTGPSVIVDEHLLQEVARKDVLHPDVYIKKNYLKKKGLQGNSDGYDYM